jgi:hypothetical protein
VCQSAHPALHTGLWKAFEEINQRAAAGFPDGLPAVGLLDLYNPDDGKVLSITLFDTEEIFGRATRP